MQILKFLNTNKDWEAILTKAPYFLRVSHDKDYVLLKYHQIDSDMSLQIVQECRGSIFRYIPQEGWKCVCRPFDKFFNYGEKLASPIDWSSARVTEKIDGSLIKIWYDNGAWHISTNGGIDAYQTRPNDMDITFGELFERALGVPIDKLYARLDREYTYLFELTAPEIRIVISYQDGIYYLTRRRTADGAEMFDVPDFAGLNIQLPKQYPLTTLEETIHAAKCLSHDEEGYVVNDSIGRRIKIKSQEYLTAAHIRFNGHMTKARILKLMKEDKIDDLLGYFPQYRTDVEEVEQEIEAYACRCEQAWKEFRKQIATEIKDHPLRSYLFYRIDHPKADAKQFLMTMLSDNSALQSLQCQETQDVKNQLQSKGKKAK